MSLFIIFKHADFFIKFLLLFLFLVSIFSWAIAISKINIIRKHMSKKVYFENLFYSGKIDEKLLETLKKNDSDNAVVNIFFTGFNALKRNANQHKNYSENEIGIAIRKKMEFKMNKEIQAVEKNIDWLATVASVSPFVGLLGTVWGIMNSFNSLAGVKTVTLAILAPSISEALLATAVGLFVAIPAVVFYNKIQIMIDDLRSQLEDFIANFCVLLINKNFYHNI